MTTQPIGKVGIRKSVSRTLIITIFSSICVLHSTESCAQTATHSRQAITQAQLPRWVSSPPRDDDDSLWGVGEGSDLDEAKRAALKSIASKLSVTISGQLESTITVNNDSVDRYARTKVSEEVRRTEFKNHTLEKTTPSEQGLYVLVRVDRQATVTDARQKLEAADKEITRLLANIDQIPAVERFLNQQRTIPWLEKAIGAAQMLLGLDSSFDGTRLRSYEVSLQRAKDSASEITFEVRANPENSDVIQAIRGVLNHSGVRVGEGGAPVVVEVIETQGLLFDSKTIKLKVNISVLDHKSRAIATREFFVSGASMADYKTARAAAIKQLGDQMKANGPINSFGFKVR